MVGAEMPMTSDQVIWSEQNRLHIAYQEATYQSAAGSTVVVRLNLASASSPSVTVETGAIRVGQTVLMADNATGLVTAKGLVRQLGDSGIGSNTDDELTIDLYETTGALFPAALQGANAMNIFVYGSEFGKGTIGMDGSIEPNFTQYSNSPIIIKDNFKINGSDLLRS